jgi:hypothetical protein
VCLSVFNALLGFLHSAEATGSRRDMKRLDALRIGSLMEDTLGEEEEVIVDLITNQTGANNRRR